jgi:hypothetical protein
VLLIVLCWQAPARAASTPPTIDDIVGTYLVKFVGVWYDFPDGFPGREPYALTWHITKISDSRVQVHIDEWIWTFTAYYNNGFLVQSSGNVSSGTAFWGALGIASFSGSPPKVKFKGNFGYSQLVGFPDNYCEWDPHKGTMISTLASQGDEQAVPAPGEGTVPLVAGSTLGIDDLPGTYSCTLSGTLYSLTAGTKEKEKLSEVWTITKIDGQTLNINSSGVDMYTHYGAGILGVADVHNDTLDTDAGFAILVAKGKPGKISLKGKLLQSRALETPDDKFEVLNVSCKQSSP